MKHSMRRPLSQLIIMAVTLWVLWKMDVPLLMAPIDHFTWRDLVWLAFGCVVSIAAALVALILLVVIRGLWHRFQDY
jgi:hypothetical protein